MNNYLQVILSTILISILVPLVITKLGKSDRTTFKQTLQENMMKPYPMGEKLFLFVGIVGIMLAILCIIQKEYTIGIFFLLLFEMLSIPILIYYKTSYVTFDLDTFVYCKFGYKKTYTYDNIQAITKSDSLRLVIQLDKKKITFDDLWENKKAFRSSIIKYKGSSIKVIEVNPIFRSSKESIESYEKGVLRKALLIPSHKEKEAKKIIRIGKCIIAISIVLAIITYLLQNIIVIGYNGSAEFFLSVVFANVLVSITYYMYFKYPFAFTMREAPANNIFIREEDKKKHKHAIYPYTVFICLLSNLFFLMCAINNAANNIGWEDYFVMSSVAIICFFIKICIFIKKSFEYKTYRVGLYSFVFFQLISSFSLFIFLLGLIQ